MYLFFNHNNRSASCSLLRRVFSLSPMLNCALFFINSLEELRATTLRHPRMRLSRLGVSATFTLPRLPGLDGWIDGLVTYRRQAASTHDTNRNWFLLLPGLQSWPYLGEISYLAVSHSIPLGPKETQSVSHSHWHCWVIRLARIELFVANCTESLLKCIYLFWVNTSNQCVFCFVELLLLLYLTQTVAFDLNQSRLPI